MRLARIKVAKAAKAARLSVQAAQARQKAAGAERSRRRRESERVTGDSEADCGGNGRISFFGGLRGSRNSDGVSGRGRGSSVLSTGLRASLAASLGYVESPEGGLDIRAKASCFAL